MPCKVFDEIIYPFPNFNGFNRWRVDMDKYFHHTRHNGCNYHVNTQSHRQHDKAMFYYSRSKDGFTILCVCLSRIFQNQIWIRETTKPLFEADSLHGDVIIWKHFLRYWPFVRGIHRSPVKFPHKGRWRGALMFSLICVWIKGWENNREAGDLRRYRAHYDVSVMGFKMVETTDRCQWKHQTSLLIHHRWFDYQNLQKCDVDIFDILVMIDSKLENSYILFKNHIQISHVFA